YKAGSLNNWLRYYSDGYKYFIVLDSDSVITSDAVWNMVRIAEHSSNCDVAIIETLILPRPGNTFQYAAAAFNSLRAVVLNRLYNRIGWTLSQGHNNLHRVGALREIGGFDTSASCEDTVTSLRLIQAGWRIIYSDVTSFDAEPTNILQHRKRTVRWARQT